jgi:SAM-dependent methyltransferase
MVRAGAGKATARRNKVPVCTPGQATLTQNAWWDQYWSTLKLPREVRRADNHSQNEILNALERFLPRCQGLSALEIGGAPGQYLAYLVRRYCYQGHILDYSRVGCEKARRNFELLGLSLSVHEGDLFSDALDIGQFDVVYSLGFVEHFSDLVDVIGRHVRLTKPGGILIVGCPNLRGVNGWFLRRLAPGLLSKHNTEAMDIRTWGRFESAHGLEVLSREYVGGLEPQVFSRREERTPASAALLVLAKLLCRLSRPALFKRLNAAAISHYALAAYRVPKSRLR